MNIHFFKTLWLILLFVWCLFWFERWCDSTTSLWRNFILFYFYDYM